MIYVVVDTQNNQTTEYVVMDGRNEREVAE